MGDMDNLKIFDAGKKTELSRKICDILGVKLGKVERKRFKDGDLSWKINENVNYISNSIESSGFFENISENYEIIIRTETNQVKLSSGELKLIRD